MSSQLNQSAVSSMTSVIKSIENDRQVYRWFLMLISVPRIQQCLTIKNETKQSYLALKKIQKTEIITYVIIALTLTASCLAKQPWILLWEALPLAALVCLFSKNRRCVACISEQFLLDNVLPDELKRQTLYQTCEYLAREYNIPSLVDIITFQDFIGRKVLLGVLLFLPFVYSFNTWQIWLFTYAAYSVTIAILNTLVVLRKLK